MAKVNKGYYTINVIGVMDNPNLSLGAKQVFAEINTLSAKTGECTATNKYIARRIGAHPNSISRWLKSLIEQGLVYSEIIKDPNTRQVMKRIITINVNYFIELAEKLEIPVKKLGIAMSTELLLSKQKEIEKKLNNNSYTFVPNNNNKSLTENTNNVSKSDEEIEPNYNSQLIGVLTTSVSEKNSELNSSLIGVSTTSSKSYQLDVKENNINSNNIKDNNTSIKLGLNKNNNFENQRFTNSDVVLSEENTDIENKNTKTESYKYIRAVKNLTNSQDENNDKIYTNCNDNLETQKTEKLKAKSEKTENSDSKSTRKKSSQSGKSARSYNAHKELIASMALSAPIKEQLLKWSSQVGAGMCTTTQLEERVRILAEKVNHDETQMISAIRTAWTKGWKDFYPETGFNNRYQNQSSYNTTKVDTLHHATSNIVRSNQPQAPIDRTNFSKF